MVPKPAEIKGSSPFQSPPKPSNTTSATLKGELLNMTPEGIERLTE
jgi:hypothetical protein